MHFFNRGFARDSFVLPLICLQLMFSSVSRAETTAQTEPKTGIFSDAEFNLQLRNYYFSRVFLTPDGATASRAEEWAQGFIGHYRSGYSNTALKWGFDVSALVGAKLDSRFSRRNTGLLALDDTGYPVDAYGRLAATLKLKAAANELRIGELSPNLPVLTFSDIRLLPPSYQGFSLTSTVTPALSLQAGQLNSTSLRNRAGRDDLQAILGHVPQFQAQSDHFRYLGADYTASQSTLLRLWYAQLADLYQQTYANWQQQYALSQSVMFKANLGYFVSSEHGEAKLGMIDNRALYALLSLSSGAHTGYIGYQHMTGDSAFPRVFANVSVLGNEVPTFEFASANERSWQARYDINFSPLGLNGLIVGVRYIRSHGAQSGAISNGRAFERDLDLAYSVQQGIAKGLSIRLRNVIARSNYRSGIDENRLILSYNLSFK